MVLNILIRMATVTRASFFLFLWLYGTWFWLQLHCFFLFKLNQICYFCCLFLINSQMNDECIGTKANGLHVVCCKHVCCTANYYICQTDPILRITSLNRRSRLTTGCLTDMTKKLNFIPGFTLAWHHSWSQCRWTHLHLVLLWPSPVLLQSLWPSPIVCKVVGDFLLQGQISVLTFQYPFHLHVTAAAHKKAGSYCQKCQWQVTAKHTCTLRTWFCVKCHSRLVHGYMVHTERVRVNSSFTWHQPCNN